MFGDTNAIKWLFFNPVADYEALEINFNSIIWHISFVFGHSILLKLFLSFSVFSLGISPQNWWLRNFNILPHLISFSTCRIIFSKFSIKFCKIKTVFLVTLFLDLYPCFFSILFTQFSALFILCDCFLIGLCSITISEDLEKLNGKYRLNHNNE